MPHSNIIATLFAVNHVTEQAFLDTFNRGRYLRPTKGREDLVSEGGTPPPMTEGSAEITKPRHRIRLSLDRPPKDVNRGFVFGSDPSCDVLLVKKEKIEPWEARLYRRVSKVHFTITFDAEQRVVLQDSSSNGSAVRYRGQEHDDIRSHFRWIMFPHGKPIVIRIPAADLTIAIKLGSSIESPEFREDIGAMFQQSSGAADYGMLMTQRLAQGWSTSGTHSAAINVGHGAIYLTQDFIGKGHHGQVSTTIDVSTGITYAQKSFHQPGRDREIQAVRELQHEHIIRFVDSDSIPPSDLLMEYMPLGNVWNMIRSDHNSVIAMLDQALQALRYMHGRHFIHRNVKPSNILISCMTPFTIKLADMGFANHDLNLWHVIQDCPNSAEYTAPEMFFATSHDAKVDIWALGAVALQLAFRFPPMQPSKQWNRKTWYYTLANHCASFVDSHNSNGLAAFLSNNMLQLDPRKRLTAADCLLALHSLRR